MNTRILKLLHVSQCQVLNQWPWLVQFLEGVNCTKDISIFEIIAHAFLYFGRINESISTGRLPGVGSPTDLFSCKDKKKAK